MSVWKAADDIQTGHCYQRDFSVVQCPLPLSLVAGPLRALALSAKGKVKNWCLAVTGCCRLRHPPADESICSLIWVARQRFMADRPQFSHRFLPLSITTSSGSKPFSFFDLNKKKQENRQVKASCSPVTCHPPPTSRDNKRRIFFHFLFFQVNQLSLDQLRMWIASSDQ